MGGENHRFGPKLQINRTLLIFICASLVAHAALFTAAFLAPEAPPEPTTYGHDCLGPTGSPPPDAPVPTSTALAGTGGTDRAPGDPASTGGGGHGSGAALGPRAALHTEYVFWPCCGPGCPAATPVPNAD